MVMSGQTVDWVLGVVLGVLCSPSVVYIEWPDGRTQETSIPTGLHSSNYKAEAEALQEAALTLLSRTDTYNSKVVLLSDAKSVLQSLKNTKGTEYNPLVRALISLNLSAQEVVLQWPL